VSAQPGASGSKPQSGEKLLLIVERNVLLAEAIGTAATNAGFHDARVVTGTGPAQALMRAFPPQIVLADLELAAVNGFELLRGIRQDFPATRVVLIADETSDRQRAVDALVAGAAGLVYRSQGVASLLRVLDVVHNGETAIPRHLTALLLDALRKR